MVSPAALYEIVDLIPKDSTPSAEYKKESSGVSLALEPLVRSISYTTTQDVLQDSMTRLRRTCSDPDFQSQPAQEDCHSRIDALKQQQEALKERSASDREHLTAQVQYYGEVAKMKGSRLRVGEGDKQKAFGEIATPPETR